MAEGQPNQRLVDLPTPDETVNAAVEEGPIPQRYAYYLWEPLEHVVHDPLTYQHILLPQYKQYFRQADWHALKVAWQRSLRRFKEEDDLRSFSGPDGYSTEITWWEPEEPEAYDPTRHTDSQANNEDYQYVREQIHEILEQHFEVNFQLPESLSDPVFDDLFGQGKERIEKVLN